MNLQTLIDIVGPDGVLTGDDVRARSVSWADHSPCQALAIVRPANTEQVSRVLAACNAARQPVARPPRSLGERRVTIHRDLERDDGEGVGEVVPRSQPRNDRHDGEDRPESGAFHACTSWIARDSSLGGPRALY